MRLPRLRRLELRRLELKKLELKKLSPKKLSPKKPKLNLKSRLALKSKLRMSRSRMSPGKMSLMQQIPKLKRSQTEPQKFRRKRKTQKNWSREKTLAQTKILSDLQSLTHLQKLVLHWTLPRKQPESKTEKSQMRKTTQQKS